MTVLSQEEVKHVAKLAKLNIKDEDLEKIGSQLSETIAFVNELSDLDNETSKLGETHQVSGLNNVFREDTVVESRVLTQEEALRNNKNTYRGYFVVDKIF